MFNIFIIYINCGLGKWYVYMSAVVCLWSPEEGVSSLGIGIRGGCEPTSMGAGD